LTRLIDETGQWLSLHKGTRQWAAPWPSREERDERVRVGLSEGRTWVVLQRRLFRPDLLVASITVAEKPHFLLWGGIDPEQDPALYPCRIMVRRSHSGLRLGAALITWVGQKAVEQWGAKSIRIDVWTDNHELHRYYKGIGFNRIGTCQSWPENPACALFELPIEHLPPVSPWPFRVPADEEAMLFS
jgi:GNAT superfamily N-acetyltransferase